jgi:hypothetical protein
LYITAGIIFQPQINVYDNFENPILKNIWSSSRMESRSFEIQSGIVRKGKSAAK